MKQRGMLRRWRRMQRLRRRRLSVHRLESAPLLLSLCLPCGAVAVDWRTERGGRRRLQWERSLGLREMWAAIKGGSVRCGNFLCEASLTHCSPPRAVTPATRVTNTGKRRRTDDNGRQSNEAEREGRGPS